MTKTKKLSNIRIRKKKTKYRRRKHNPKSKKGRNQTFKKGGKKIGSGTYGCVYKPALRCRGNTKRKKNAISKFMKKRHAKSEIRENERIEELDPEGKFHVKIFEVCVPNEPKEGFNENYRENCPKVWNPKKTELDKYRLIIERDGGIQINHAIKELPELKKGVTSRRRADWWNRFFAGMERLFYGVMKMSEAGFIHNDIKTDNVLINPETLEMNFIDFGLSLSRERMKEEIIHPEDNDDPGRSITSFFLMQPPESFILSNYPLYVQQVETMVSEDDDEASEYIETLHKKYLKDYRSDNKYTQYTRNTDQVILPSDLQRNKLEFPDDAWTYLDLYHEERLDEILSKWDLYALGIAFATLWTQIFESKILSDETDKVDHPLYYFQYLFAKMLAVEYIDRITPKQAYIEFRKYYMLVFDKLIYETDNELTINPPLSPIGNLRRVA
jgi:serine/threonine protein kinase